MTTHWPLVSGTGQIAHSTSVVVPVAGGELRLKLISKCVVVDGHDVALESAHQHGLALDGSTVVGPDILHAGISVDVCDDVPWFWISVTVPGGGRGLRRANWNAWITMPPRWRRG